jgi:hypothetical protein
MSEKTTTIALTPADRKLVATLKRKYEPEHGKLSTTGLIRVLLRKAA